MQNSKDFLHLWMSDMTLKLEQFYVFFYKQIELFL